MNHHTNTAREDEKWCEDVMIKNITLKPPTYSFWITEGSFQKDAVASQKLIECVADGISSFPDPDGLHHTRVTELTHAQLSVKQLRQRRSGIGFTHTKLSQSFLVQI